MNATRLSTLALLAASLLGLGSSGCATEAFCFADCAGDGSGGGGNLGGTGGAILGDAGPDSPILNTDSGTGGGGDGGAAAINDENCNGLDDDRDGEIDEDVNFGSVIHCGTCDTNCLLAEHVVGPACTPPAVVDGTEAGECGYERCETDFYDLEPLVDGCEYYCPWNPAGTNTTDPGGAAGCGVDDDCDGEVDEDVGTCDDLNNCGACGATCVTPNAVPVCLTTATTGEDCTTANTGCAIESCTDGWIDADGSADNGCEYQCTPTDGAGAECADPADCPEVCDGRDNDCDKLIDNTDPSLETGEPALGDACFGGEYGVCVDATHEGLAKCIGGQLQCCDPDSNAVTGNNPNVPTTGLRNAICDADTGTQVVRPGQSPEVCNGLDDDCDGSTDNSLTDVGSSCGVSGTGACSFGVYQCVAGVRTCAGNVDPLAADLCNGKDDDCDGVIDGTAPAGTPVTCANDAGCTGGLVCLPSALGGAVCASPPSDSVGSCNEPTSLPAGSTGISACTAGVRRCIGGTRQCVGSTTAAPGAVDTCGHDNDCDGVLEAEAEFLNDPDNCGACGNACGSGNPFSVWSCVDGACVAGGCVTGRIDCNAADGPSQCERPCTKTSETEQCNGVDDDCDCLIDGADTDSPPVAPTPAQACGVSSTATEAGCTSGVTVACTTGAWRCTFPAGYCQGTHPSYCLGQGDPCDGVDNNCSGLADEQFVPPRATSNAKGLNCPLGVGACRVTGEYQCNAAGTATECVGTPGTPGTETCNGLDDDCDGSVDETYMEPGTGASFVRPAVVRVDTSLWMFAYEASRPNATTTSTGSGNGFFSAAPAGQTLDQTVACSVQSRLPWVNVTPWEVEQTCDALGGRICDVRDWQDTCWVNQAATSNDCLYGYSPLAQCDGPAAYPPGAGPYCNLGPYDFSTTTAGNQNGLLPTRALFTAGACAADWTGTTGLANTLDAYDITGNAREITRCQRDRAVCAQGVADSATATAICAVDCCSGTSQSDDGAPADYRRVCGSFGNNNSQYERRLSGQLCSNNNQCCNFDDRCSTGTASATNNGVCGNVGGANYCRNLSLPPVPAICRTRGVVCTASTQCCNGDPCVDGICGGATALPHAVYPLFGGGYATATEAGASCDFDFFKVEPDFKLFDSGFRCCFDANPSP